MTQNLVAKASTTIEAPQHTVWKALITPAALKQFMFGSDISSDWREGGPITWKGEWQGRPYKDKGTIKRAEPGRVLQYTHFSPLSGQPDVEENYHTVTVELMDAGDETRVILTQDNNRNEEEREHSQKNWEMMLQSLKKFVEG